MTTLTKWALAVAVLVLAAIVALLPRDNGGSSPKAAATYSSVTLRRATPDSGSASSETVSSSGGMTGAGATGAGAGEASLEEAKFCSIDSPDCEACQ